MVRNLLQLIKIVNNDTSYVYGNCAQCNSDNAVGIITYKRTWMICKECGTALSVFKEKIIHSNSCRLQI